MEVGVVGKPNVGKSTFFSALTLLDVAIAPYPFTTTKPNRGTAAVRVKCPHSERGVACTPGNARCIDGTRWVPVIVIDVPGLVPGAHEGKGLGHQFLDDLRAADGFVQVVDLSGGTSAEGTLTPGAHNDPSEEVRWLEEELVAWVAEVLGRDFERGVRSLELDQGKVEEFVAKRLTGLTISVPSVAAALRVVPLDREHPSRWNAEDRRQLSREILRVAKPRLIAANKCDRADAAQAQSLSDAVSPLPVVPTCAEAELTLRRADRAGLVRYRPGDGSFQVPDPARLSAPQQHALDEIRSILRTWGTTGVQTAFESMVFDRLRHMVVFPVEDENKWTDSKGRVLPDAILTPIGTPARAFAYRVHSELGEHFIRAIDARTHRALGADAPLEPNSVVRIVARR